jgi:hypothetical protein
LHVNEIFIKCLGRLSSLLDCIKAFTEKLLDA